LQFHYQLAKVYKVNHFVSLFPNISKGASLKGVLNG
jgi:hypothetical protein